MSLDRPDLSAAFTNKKAPIDRASGLTGLLPAPRPRPSTSPSTTAPSTSLGHGTDAAREPSPDTATAPATESTTLTTVRPIRTSKNPPVSHNADITTNVAVYLEADLLELVKARRRSADLTYDAIVSAAFADVDESLLRAAFTHQNATADSSGMPARKRRLRGTAGIQLQLRLDTAQRTWLADTQQRIGAPSRSALIAAVLRLHLTA